MTDTLPGEPRASFSPRARFALELSSYVVLTFVSFLPQSLRPWDTVAHIGDPLDTTYFIAWNAHQFYRDPVHLFEANILFPNPAPMTLAGHRILLGVILAPIIWVSGNPILAYNAGIGLVSIFTALTGRYLAGALGIHPVGAWATGALYGFHTYQVNEAPRLDLLLHGLTFLALAQLVRYLRSGRPRHAWSAAGLMALQGYASHYLLLYGALLLSIVIAAVLIARPRLFLARAAGLALPALAAATLLLPLAVPQMRSAARNDLRREVPRGVDLRHFAATAQGNRLYGQIGGEVRLQQRAAHFVGFASFGLVLVALVAHFVRSDRRTGNSFLEPALWVPAGAALAALFVALSLGKDAIVLGHTLGPGPYRLLYRFVPGFAYIRIPERFALLAMFFVALLVGRGLHLLAAGGQRAAAFILAVLVPIEHLTHLPATRVPAGRTIPAVYDWLASTPVNALAEVPIHGEALVRKETLEEYLSTRHFRPIVHGYVSYPPLLTRLLRRLAAEFPSEATLQAFRRVGVDTVIVHHGRPVGVDLKEKLRWADARGSAEMEARLMAEARLDLFAQLPEAVRSGRIGRLARFEGASGRVYEGTVDEVYRIGHAPATIAPARLPEGRRVRGAGWTYRAKLGDAGLAADGRMETAWMVVRPLRGDEFWEVSFDRPLTVSGLVLALAGPSVFPTRFRVAGRDTTLRWREVARYDDAHTMQLLEQLLRSPRGARLAFDLGGRTLTGISLLVADTGTSYEGWSLPEVEVWVP